MSIPHTFGDKSGSVLLGDLDYNFTTLDTRLGVVESTAVTQTSLTSSLSSYATTASLSSYATTDALSSALSSYATTASLSSYATTASLSSYATIASLSDKADLTGANFTGNVNVTGTLQNGGSNVLVDSDIGATVGYPNIPAVGTKTTSYSLTTSDVGKYVQVGSGGSITIPNSTFSEGDAITIFNNTTGNITITCSITTAYIAGTNIDVASVTLATRGLATILFISGTVCAISGNVL